MWKSSTPSVQPRGFLPLSQKIQLVIYFSFFFFFSPNLSFAGMFEILTSCLKNNFLPLWWKIRMSSEGCMSITGFLHFSTKWKSPDTKIKDVSTLICSSILPVSLLFHSCARRVLWISSSPFYFSWKIFVSFYYLTSYHIGGWLILKCQYLVSHAGMP